MARVRVQGIVEHLSSQVRRALEAAVKEVLPDAVFDPYDLYRAFKRAVGRNCGQWEQVPDHLVG